VKHLLLGTWILLAAALAWCAPNNGAARIEPVVHLRDAIEVKGKRVWLADLLPPDAPSSIQKASAAIEICQAPQPGSARVLDAEQITIKLAGQPDLLRQLAIPPLLTVRNAAWPIAEEAVRLAISKFLRQQGWKHDLPAEARLEWLPPLAPSEEHPSLQVMGLDWDDRQQSIQVRLRCSMRASCSSFLVHVILALPLGEEWHERLRSGINPGSPASGLAASDNRDGAVMAEKGKPATLILDDGSLRISLRVICLQPGVLNQQIRVIDARSRRVFHAEVVGRGILHATL